MFTRTTALAIKQVKVEPFMMLLAVVNSQFI